MSDAFDEGAAGAPRPAGNGGEWTAEQKQEYRKKKAREEADREVPNPAAVEGRVPPHDLDAEAAVISATLIDPLAFDKVSDLLEPEYFYSERHRRIWEACKEITLKGIPIDIVNVGSELKRTERLLQVGGMGYLTEVLNAAPAVANVRHYAREVVKHYGTRQLILMCQRTAAAGYLKGETEGLLERHQTQVLMLTETKDVKGPEHNAEVMRSTYDRIVQAYEQGRPPGIGTGFTRYDNLTGGWHRKEVTIVAARPGMGKTSFMLCQAINVAGGDPMLMSDDGGEWRPQGVAIFSLEMPREQLGEKMLSIESGVDHTRIRFAGRLSREDWQRIPGAASKLSSMPIWVDDEPAITLGNLRAKVRRIKIEAAQMGVDLVAVLIDYLQLMQDETGATSRDAAIGNISRGLKVLAKQENVALTALAQLNRQLETRAKGEKRPRISDLRESGNIEQDADNIVFIYRPEAYDEAVDDDAPGTTELIVAKQRNGPQGTALCRFLRENTRFEDLS